MAFSTFSGLLRQTTYGFSIRLSFLCDKPLFAIFRVFNTKHLVNFLTILLTVS
jgi:hypothetical protein